MLYVGWVGESVEYYVSYWFEKFNVVVDFYLLLVFMFVGGSILVWGLLDGVLSVV